ncbi:esterase-like activity of phytase family protein [Oleiagrimonas soli]|uniref:Phytase-like domain-containing protein n=1 Tax=Oleiagrimonas soli TaxID=1543381 RepID=A0A841KK23_9GAMM|nr:esterase-like activity of phytase family protein [Oleiagrimonas soli]MBB6182981.1 hypothetical protein [Oleiagrimonas soli]
MRRALVLLFVLLPTMAGAKAVLLAYGSLPGTHSDRAVATAKRLADGVPGNRFGGLGSALDYAGCDTFLALPDRGPNAVAWNRALDETTAYVNRVQTLRLTLAKAASDGRFPLQVQARLLKTTLLWSRERLRYGSGAGLHAASGVPPLNAQRHRFYFTGRSDGYDPAHASDWPGDARLDPESLRLAPDGRSFYLGDEYGPHLYRFDRASGRRLGIVNLPAALAVAHPAPTGAVETKRNARGRVGNHGLEGLAITPDGRTLIGAVQGALIQDGGAHGGFARLVRIDLVTGRMHSYAYPLQRVGGTDAKPRYAGISEIVAVNDHVMLVDERGGGGAGSGQPARIKRIYRIDLRGARAIDGLHGVRALAARAVHKHLFVDLVARLGRHGITPAQVPEKFEGLSFGRDVRVHGHWRHTLWVSTDNDFLPTPNRFLVVGFDDTDLPGLRRMPKPLRCRDVASRR